MIRFGSNEWGDGLVDARMLNNEQLQQRYVSRHMLAKLIGVDNRTLSDWASKGKINLKEISTGKHKRFIANTDGFAPPIHSGEATLSIRDAARRIDLPVAALLYLKNSRHYDPRYMPPFKRGFHPSDLDNFVQLLLSKSEVLKTPPLLPTMNLGYVMQEVRFWSDSGKGQFIAAFLDGEIQSVGRLDDQISTTLFLRSDVESYVRQSRIEASGGAISLKEASKIIGYDAPVVADLVRAKFLEGRPGPFRLRIGRESLDQFTSQYVSMQSIARELSTTT